MSDFSRGQHLKARRPHRCEWCRQTIEVGEVHHVTKGIFDGSWFTRRDHLDCEEAIQREYKEEGHNMEYVSWEDNHDRGKTLKQTEEHNETAL